jgi:hypothetical protein
VASWPVAKKYALHAAGVMRAAARRIKVFMGSVRLVGSSLLVSPSAAAAGG